MTIKLLNYLRVNYNEIHSILFNNMLYSILFDNIYCSCRAAGCAAAPAPPPSDTLRWGAELTGRRAGESAPKRDC
jgi:hypothetical protein